MNADHPSLEQSSSRHELVEEELSYAIRGGFYDVYNEFGYGLLEAPYARALDIVLKAKGLLVEREYAFPIVFKGQQIGFHRVDMVVERRVIVEIKSTEAVPESAKRQLRCYLNVAKLRLGLLLHFGPKAEVYRILGPLKSQTTKL